jgi:hypothetical protein
MDHQFMLWAPANCHLQRDRHLEGWTRILDGFQKYF